MATLSQRIICVLFSCPDRPPPAQPPTPNLVDFIAYALYRTRLHPSVTFTALFLLSRLKSRFPEAKGSSGHRLFLPALMLASKVICDDTYSNRNWTIVGQGLFSLRELNTMERDLCFYLQWELNVDPKELRDFEAKVHLRHAPQNTCPPLDFSPFIEPLLPPPTSQTVLAGDALPLQRLSAPAVASPKTCSSAQAAAQ